jgi:hypothetical protein
MQGFILYFTFFLDRFRMKMKVKHGEHVVVFAVFDQEVKKLAIETCPILISMVSVECIHCLF